MISVLRWVGRRRDPFEQLGERSAAVRNEIEIVRADGSVLYVQNDVEPLYDTRAGSADASVCASI